MLAQEALPTGGLALDSIEAEATPALIALVQSLAEHQDAWDVESFHFRECLSLSALLGRRLALLDLTPTAALRIVELLLTSVGEEGGSRTSRFGEHLRAAVVEGFVRGREERIAEQSAVRAAAPVRPLRLDASIFLLAVTGEHAPESLSNMVDALGRDMLDGDASVALVDLTQLAEPDRDRARAVFGADEMARMLGASCVFSGVDPRWKAAAVDARIPLDGLHWTTTLDKGLALARAIADGAEAGANPRWRVLLERLRR